MARRGWRADPEATAAGVRKQALVPAGATVLEPVGHRARASSSPRPRGAPGRRCSSCPARRRSCRACGPAAVADRARAAGAGRRAPSCARRPCGSGARSRRSWPSSSATHDAELAGLEITTCMRDGELEIVTRFAPDAQPAYDRLGALLAERLRPTRCSRPAPPWTRSWRTGFADRGLTVATAESCTGGLLAARLTERPGSSAWVLGGVTAYANSAKEQLLGVPADVARRARRGQPRGGGRPGRGRAGAVRRRRRGRASPASPARAAGRRTSRSAPCTSASPARTAASCARCGCPASRSAVRERSVTMAMHLLRVLLVGGPPA